MLSQPENGLYHVFVESTVDMLFYKPHIHKTGVITKAYDCSNRDGVLNVMELISKQTKRSNECIFMIDADYKRFTCSSKFMKHAWSPRLFVTEGYSIENYFRIDEVFEYIIRDRNGRDLSSQQSTDLLSKINSDFLNIKSKFAIISALMIEIRNQDIHANFNNFSFDGCFNIREGICCSKGHVIRRFLGNVGVDIKSINFKNVILQMRQIRSENLCKWIRGKYYMDALIKIFACTINSKNLKKIPHISCYKKPKQFNICSPDEFVELYAPRINTPSDFESFLRTRLSF
jgi:hypothetical protein